LYTEEIVLWEKAQDNGLTDEEKKRLEYLGKVLDRLLKRFLKHSRIANGLWFNGLRTTRTDLTRDQEE
jgi:hypothetical protein